MIDFSALKGYDDEVYASLQKELLRQENNIELIASENFVSKEVMMAAGSHLTNKYAEGYPGRRYYGGCKFVDEIEQLAIDRAKTLFSAEYANVQPHSGSSANFQVYFSCLNVGDTILGMNLNHGGHLTHGSKVNISGKYFNFISYGVDENGYIDYDELEKIAIDSKPKMIVAGASAYPRAIDFARFKKICQKVGAIFMVDMAHIAGLVATGYHMSPVPYADIVTTTTHKTLRGPRGGLILAKEQFGKIIDKAVFPGTQGGPLMHIIAAKAVSFKEALTDEFKVYQGQIVANATKMAEVLQKEGLKLFSNGTDNHLMLLDLRPTGLSGRDLEVMLDEVNITTNKNSIPFDEKASPMNPNGLRIGTPSVTTRGMKEDEMVAIATSIAKIVKYKEQAFDEVRLKVKELTTNFPLYKNIIKM